MGVSNHSLVFLFCFILSSFVIPELVFAGVTRHYNFEVCVFIVWFLSVFFEEFNEMGIFLYVWMFFRLNCKMWHVCAIQRVWWQWMGSFLDLVFLLERVTVYLSKWLTMSPTTYLFIGIILFLIFILIDIHDEIHQIKMSEFWVGFSFGH